MIIVWLNSVLCENGYSSLMDYENDCVSLVCYGFCLSTGILICYCDVDLE